MSELIEDIRKPISEAAPCGEDVKYDDDYGLLQAEINKTAGNDWKMVVDLGHAMLSQKSKDLNVATWLCIGLLQLQGFDGLADGLEGYQMLLQEYWGGLYPQRDRPREMALRMLSSKLGGDLSTMGFVEARQATDSDANALQRIRETLKVLNTEIQDKFPGGALSLKNIADAIEEKLNKIGPPPADTSVTSSTGASQPATEESRATADTKPSAEEKQETSPEEPPAATPPVTTPQRTGEPTQTTDEATTLATSEWKTRYEAINTIIQAAAFLRSDRPQDVTPYRLLRAVRWDIWQELPSDWRNNKSSFLLPQIEMKSNLDALVKSENWEALLKQSEELFAEGNCHFWLDLQRYIDTALKGLGTDYDAVRKAIIQETAMFVDRLPAITEFSYQDGTEFADEETKAWIEKEVRSTLDDEQKPPPPEVTTSRPDIEVGGDEAKVEISIKIFTK